MEWYLRHVVFVVTFCCFNSRHPGLDGGKATPLAPCHGLNYICAMHVDLKDLLASCQEHPEEEPSCDSCCGCFLGFQ